MTWPPQTHQDVQDAIEDLRVTAAIPGDDGREVELSTSATHVQWRYVGDTAWTNLVALADLKGDPGPPGSDATAPVSSVAGKTGAVTLVKGDVGLGLVDNTADMDKPVSNPQTAAMDGALAGKADVGYVDQRAVPAGGAAGQILAKNTATDRDTGWVNPPAAPFQPVTTDFASPGTFTYEIPEGCSELTFIAVGAGGGGGSGRSNNSTSTSAWGGGGGAGGGQTIRTFARSDVPGSTLEVVVGAGGTGGAPAVNANGVGGTSGGASYVVQPSATTPRYAQAGGGNGGAAGTTTSGGGGGAGIGLISGTAGGGSSATANAAAGAFANNNAATGGGGGGGYNGTTPTAYAGGNGGGTNSGGPTGNVAATNTVDVPGATSGTSVTGSGNPAHPSYGAKGGSASTTGAAGRGGNGGWPGGGGGGGGVSVVAGAESGRGGDGGSGAVRIVAR